jgi:Ca2+-binding RTX toxin-like protein
MWNDDRLYGRGGADRLLGSDGSDHLDGGAGKDVLYGGIGDDSITSNDGVADRIGCGDGYDIVTADLHDKVAEDCEQVTRTS